jgi:hypothetical protein
MRVGVVQTAAQVAEASWHPASLVVVQVREAWALAGVRGSGGSGPGSCNERGKSPGPGSLDCARERWPRSRAADSGVERMRIGMRPPAAFWRDKKARDWSGQAPPDR